MRPMTEAEPLAILGGGKMGEALLGGLLRSGRPPATLSIVEKVPARRADLARRHPGVAVLEAPEQFDGPGVVLAVKPGDVEEVCRVVAERAGVRRVLSIAAGVRLGSLEGWLAELPGVAVVRAMPNIPALVGAAASGVAPGRDAGPEDVAWARAVLEGVGTVVTLEESDLDAVTGLSGSGPAYVFLLAEAMIDGGAGAGLDREVARSLVVQTVLGAARLLAESGEEASALREAVTSPKGTTEAGLRALESAGFRRAVAAAVRAGTERSRELAGPASST